jgi:hypothetical protein
VYTTAAETGSIASASGCSGRVLGSPLELVKTLRGQPWSPRPADSRAAPSASQTRLSVQRLRPAACGRRLGPCSQSSFLGYDRLGQCQGVRAMLRKALALSAGRSDLPRVSTLHFQIQLQTVASLGQSTVNRRWRTGPSAAATSAVWCSPTLCQAQQKCMHSTPRRRNRINGNSTIT